MSDTAVPSRPTPGWSLTGRLAVLVTGAVVLAVGLGGGAMYLAASNQEDQMLDARLEQFGATLQVLLEDVSADRLRDGGADGPPLKTRPTASSLYEYQVWVQEGPTLLLRSHEAPGDRPLAGFDRLGYTDARIDGEEFRVFSLPSRDRRMLIQVAENRRETWNPAGQTSAYYLVLLMLPFGALMAVVWYLTRRALRSIHNLADTLRRRNPLEASPLPLGEPPQELVPILEALDRLFARMRHAFSVERRFTSMAAHELRTPLAGLRANAQLLDRAGLHADARETVGELIHGVDRAAHMLQQLLDLARIEGLENWHPAQAEPVAIAEMSRELIAELRPKAEARGVSLMGDFEVEHFACHGFAIGVLVRNLLSNAIQYSPAGGQVYLRWARDGDAVRLSVDDSGPGIPEGQRERVFERFERLGRNQGDGVGLGLSIVLSVAQMHQARVQLVDSALGGLGVRVHFAPSAAPLAA